MLSFAVAGVPLSTPKPGGTVKGLKHAHSLGIFAMEMEWVQMVPKNIERIEEIHDTAGELKMNLTVHAPYYINLNSLEADKLAASKKRILDALTMAQIAGAKSVCVHAAFNGGMPPEKVYDNVRKQVDEIMKHKALYFPDVNLGLETMGKPTQFGTLEDCLKISKEFGNYPCMDPAHMHARTNGKVNSIEEWDDMLDLYVEYLGKKSLATMHLHFSGINYGIHGEKNHLPLQESDAKWEDFLFVLKKRNVGGQLVCESPLLEKDTLLMQQTYERLKV